MLVCFEFSLAVLLDQILMMMPLSLICVLLSYSHFCGLSAGLGLDAWYNILALTACENEEPCLLNSRSLAAHTQQ